MSIEQVLRTVAERGLTLRLDGTDLRLEGAQSRIDSSLIASIRAVKAEIVAHFEGLRADPDAAHDAFASTPMQQSYFYGRQEHFALGEVASHVYHEIEGVFDAAGLERALAAVVRRHGALRTVFRDDALQVELEFEVLTPPYVKVTDLRNADGDVTTGRAARLATREAMSHQRLPADRAPLIDVRLTILSDREMVLHVSHDGLVMDGISSFLFFRDWWRFYRSPEDVPAALDISFRHYVEALAAGRSGPAAERARSYWLGRLGEIAPAPQLPRRGDPATLRRPSFVRHTIEVDAARWACLKTGCVRAGLTPTAMLASAYADVLSRWGGGDRFTLNMTVANRLQLHPDIDQVIGNFTDCLLLSVDHDSAASFSARALKLQDGLRQALDHRQFSGIEVMRALGRHQGLAQAVPMTFTFNSTIGATCDGSSIACFGREVYAVSQTPQVLLNLFVLERNGALVVEVDAVDEAFPEGLVSDVVAAYGRLLHALAETPSEWQKREHTLLPPRQAERRREVNRTDAPIPPGLAYAAFLTQVERDPEAVAIIAGVHTITYRMLRDAAIAIAARLKRHDVGRHDVVALVMRKGWEEVAGILGILLAGAAYLPLGAGLPEARLRALLRESAVRCVLSQQDTGDIAGTELDRIVVDASLFDAAEANSPMAFDGDQRDLAYVLYTSGSTGRPKGVMVSHRGIVNLVTDITGRLAIGPRDRFFAVTQTAFDLSVFDIFGALSVGAALVIPCGDAEADPARWLTLAGDAGVTVWNSVPSTIAALLDEAGPTGSGLPPTLRLALLSGDRIPVALPARLMATNPALRVVALGGPTETTVWNIIYPIERLEPAWSSIPYGRPTANNRYYVLDGDLRECPDWVPGELYAAGVGLAEGYWSDPDLTAARFVHHPQLAERLYRTGDIGRYTPDGDIEILGRADFQIKLNGYRIEPAEIEAALERHLGIARAVVILRTVAGEAPHLVAFVVAAEGVGRPTPDSELADELSAALPSYMVPRRFVWLAELPLTPNGKVDRGGLKTIALPDEAAAAAALPPTPVDTALARQLVTIWSEILRDDAVDIDSPFFALGGTSLQAVRLLARVRKEFKMSVPLQELPRFETPRAMARHIESRDMRAAS
ncbi:amino acid adenylation domain-containing protein [Bradyrhizobium sp. U87765 SZCCT0131]|uniref:non-ribosomal peptide synthetase n=2 Tax=Bradyrhizobium TaxID=374 RepID=UPI001BAC9A82|nr:non-ribosomal peptide synthetase [Bradyrhizobium sp. U87765 SZCCT0109]MBR1217845.1 amino acid adenylation domain-containing protein [Bradyrhizobium sp. U87765 SZCCT0131]MBR1261209.1 amino acid adenylation domain-containing protein [Bradyrhizobium sp. U87765 SZCCT0134]MBR1303343.1 amino acid adenylation domain-containing protein [Bradyrhizobium sp. U87765 SZCCT0110]MBR1347274.1 amino acid adenylation domain-containing protein [Bradyrhizobium sp. U87765 SZCCT0048]MBR1318949.1 amino acid adeny